MEENNGEVDGVPLQPLLKIKLFVALPLYIIFLLLFFAMEGNFIKSMLLNMY